MTANQREHALAALNRIQGAAEMIDDAWGGDKGTTRSDVALIRAALTPPPLPADLAEIQARADAVRAAYNDVLISDEEPEPDDPIMAPWHTATMLSAADVPALVAELAELRARPTLTAEEAYELDGWMMPPGRGSIAADAREKLRTIAERVTL
jgi:hypothetical protein